MKFNQPDVVMAIAMVAYEAIRAYSAAMGEVTKPAWEDAPDQRKDAYVDGVRLHLENPAIGPRAGHEAWAARMTGDGWSYGPTVIPELKQHNCLVPFEDLPLDQRAKGHIFAAVVCNMSPLFEPPVEMQAPAVVQMEMGDGGEVIVDGESVPVGEVTPVETQGQPDAEKVE